MNLADIMLFYLECGIKFISEFGDVDDRFYHSMGSVCANAYLFIYKNNLETQFKTRALGAITDSLTLGWGFSEYLTDTYVQYFDDFEEE